MSSNADANDQMDGPDCDGSMLTNCPNFRRLCPEVRIYRSSRPDLLTDEETEFFRDRLHIKTIIDMRSVSEYKKATGDKLVSNYYSMYELKAPQQRNYGQQELVECVPIECQRLSRSTSSCTPDAAASRSTSSAPPSPPPTSSSPPPSPSSSPSRQQPPPEHPNTNINTDDSATYAPAKDPVVGHDTVERRHYLLDIFKSYPWLVFSRTPWYIRLYSVLVLLFDLVWRTGFKNFVGLYVRTVLNPPGILGQYKDMIEIGSSQIRAALKLLSSPDHLPALLNCTFGKDRTGVICALILACLGKDKVYISKNYAQSAILLEKEKEVLIKEMTAKYQLNETFITAREETMVDLLDYIEEKYGSVAGYMEHIGFSREEQRRLCENICG